jgi:hypothetical protein
MTAPDLKSMEGEVIHALIPFFDRVRIQPLKLRRVEDAGIWVESQGLTNQILDNAGYAAAPKTLVLFLPWHQIVTIWSSIDSPALSEKQMH